MDIQFLTDVFDQWLYPFYKHDVDNGIITKEFALELLEVEYVKMNNATKLKDKGSMALRNGRGFGGESLTVGGVDRYGHDATNDMTMLCLEASVHTRMMNPWLCVRMHKDTPYETAHQDNRVYPCRIWSSEAFQ